MKIEVYPSQTLVKGAEMWKAVRGGIVDIGWCFHGYWPEMTPLADVISLPGLPMTTAEKSSEVLWKLYEKYPAIQKEFAEAPPLALWTTTPYFLLTSKKQVKTLEDLKGMKIRVPGGPPTEQMKALGAVPTLIPMPDNYQALDKGVIDGMGAVWEAMQGFRLYEVAKYYTMVPLASAYFSLCTNKAKWESLPKDVRDAIMSVSGLQGSKFWGRNFFDTAEQAVVDQGQGRQARDDPLHAAGGRDRPLEQDRRRADPERLGEEDGRQGRAGCARHPQHDGGAAEAVASACRVGKIALSVVDAWARRTAILPTRRRSA